MPGTSYPFTVTNTYGQPVAVYETMTKPATNPPSTNAADYLPDYTLLGTVDSDSGSFSTEDPIARIVIARSSDDFPVKLAIVDALDPDTQSVSVAGTDATTAESAWAFYQSFASQPYQPMALQFNELVLTNTDPTSLNSQAAAFFSANGYPGVDFGAFSMVSYWATNSLQAIPGTYWCYPVPTGGSGFILPTVSNGTITIADGTAAFQPVDDGAQVALTYSAAQLASAGSTPQSGIALTGIFRDLTFDGRPGTTAMCFVGTDDGAQFIAQPYQDPSLPWYAVAYDLVYGGFTVVQLAMAIDGAITILSGIPGGIQWLGQNVGKLADSVRSWANDVGDSAGPESAAGGDVEPINVDVDVDVDIDIDVDVDVDVDIDVDVDVDIDVDVLAVVDVDIDIDIDVDIDIDIEVDVDVDVDVDTDVDVEPGMIRGLLNSLGSWILTKAMPALLEMAVINFAFYSAGKLLEAWKDADQQGIADLQPRESTGLGLLVNYLLNEQVPILTRWTTVGDYVQQSSANPTTVEMVITSVSMAANDTADAAVKAWRWSTDDFNAAVAAMNAYSGPTMYQAFTALGGYTYNGQQLPVKVGAGVAMAYLKSQS